MDLKPPRSFQRGYFDTWGTAGSNELHVKQTVELASLRGAFSNLQPADIEWHIGARSNADGEEL